jgi:hypothetical protein
MRVSVETLRKWMVAEGVWLTRDRRLPRAHQPRYRRPCLGELVQIDGCGSPDLDPNLLRRAVANVRLAGAAARR